MKLRNDALARKIAPFVVVTALGLIAFLYWPQKPLPRKAEYVLHSLFNGDYSNIRQHTPDEYFGPDKYTESNYKKLFEEVVFAETRNWKLGQRQSMGLANKQSTGYASYVATDSDGHSCDVAMAIHKTNSGDLIMIDEILSLLTRLRSAHELGNAVANPAWWLKCLQRDRTKMEAVGIRGAYSIAAGKIVPWDKQIEYLEQLVASEKLSKPSQNGPGALEAGP